MCLQSQYFHFTGVVYGVIADALRQPARVARRSNHDFNHLLNRMPFRVSSPPWQH